MSTATQSFLIPFISVCLFSSILYGAFYAVTSLAGLRRSGPPKAVFSQAITGFVPPLVILFAWDIALNKAVSFNLISLVWLLLLAFSVFLLATKAARFAVAKAYGAGLLLGCCTFFVCAICLAMLD